MRVVGWLGLTYPYHKLDSLSGPLISRINFYKGVETMKFLKVIPVSSLGDVAFNSRKRNPRECFVLEDYLGRDGVTPTRIERLGKWRVGVIVNGVYINDLIDIYAIHRAGQATVDRAPYVRFCDVSPFILEKLF